MSNDGIDIKGIDKAELLAALYNNSRAQGTGFLHFEAADMTRDQAQKIIESHPGHAANTGPLYFDYLKGRVMKVDIGGDVLTPYLYDRDLGQGACERVINSLR